MTSIRIYQHWWLLTIKGAIAVLFGLFALFTPDIAIVTLATVFGVIALIGGILLIIGAISHSRSNRAWKGWVLEGVLDILVGMLLIFFPGATVTLFFILLAIWAIFMGVIYIVGAFKFRDVLPGWQLSLVGGILSLAFGLLIAIRPFEGAKVFTALAGLAAVIIGGMMIYHSFRVRNLNKQTDSGTYIYID